MNRILLAVVTSIVALSLAAFSTFATWNDTVTVTDNRIITGTADLQVSNVEGGGSWNSDTVASSYSVSGLVPGGTAGNGFSFALWNNSSTGVDFTNTAQITAVTLQRGGVDVTPAQDQLEISVVEEGVVPVDGDYRTLASWQSGSYTIGTVLDSGDDRNYYIYARLKNTAENEWQGVTVNFTLTVEGSQ